MERGSQEDLITSAAKGGGAKTVADVSEEIEKLKKLNLQRRELEKNLSEAKKKKEELLKKTSEELQAEGEKEIQKIETLEGEKREEEKDIEALEIFETKLGDSPEEIELSPIGPAGEKPGKKSRDRERKKKHPPVPLYLTAAFGAAGIIIAIFIGGPVVAYKYFAMVYILLATFLWTPLLWMLWKEGKTAAAYLLFLFSLLNLLVVLVPLGLSGT